MLYERTVRLHGNVKQVWQRLEETLIANGYTIGQQFPTTRLSASKGNKLLTGLTMVNTATGYRELSVTLIPKSQPSNELEVNFRFSFPGYGVATTSGARAECEHVVNEFAAMAESDATSASVCPNCQAANPAGAAFCSECGTKLGAIPVCAKCGAPLRPGTKFCGACGASVA